MFWLGTADQGSTSKTALTYFEEHGLKDVEPYDGDNANLQHSSVRIWTQSQGKAIFELFTRPFWKQIWTITHISFASQETIKLLCGSKEVGWAPVANTIKKLQLIQDHGALHRLKYGPEVMETPGFQIIHYKTLWDASTVEHKISSMRETIESTVDFTAKDPRDKIFAILPFTHKQSAFWSNFDVKPDYSKSPQDVFLESIRATVLFEEFQARADRATFAQTLTASMDIDIQANDALRAATNQVLNIHHIDTFWTQDFFLSPLVQVFAVRQLEDMPSRTAPFLADPLTLDIIIMWVRHVILQLESMYQTVSANFTVLASPSAYLGHSLTMLSCTVEGRLYPHDSISGLPRHRTRPNSFRSKDRTTSSHYSSKPRQLKLIRTALYFLVTQQNHFFFSPHGSDTSKLHSTTVD